MKVGPQAHVFIWETKIGNEEGVGTTVGHAAIQVENKGEQHYLSFRPKKPSWVNPFCIWKPTRGENFQSVDQDTEYEGKAPDRKITIPLSEAGGEALSNKIKNLESKIKQEELLYQLTPRFSALTLMKMLSTKSALEETSRCPFSGQPMEDSRYLDLEKIQNLEVGHCATTVFEALDAVEDLKLPKTGRAPWVITPTQLGDILQ